VLVLAACGGEPEGANARGAGLEDATLDVTSRAAAYAEALRGVFDVGPGLVLLLDPALLPRNRSAEPRDTLDPAVVRALARTGTVQGTCAPSLGDPRTAPICPATMPGYIIRLSPIFQARGDTIQLFVTAERYRATVDTTTFQPPLHIEQRYELVPSRNGWTVARKARLAR
jgi:hypothetical protein